MILAFRKRKQMFIKIVSAIQFWRSLMLSNGYWKGALQNQEGQHGENDTYAQLEISEMRFFWTFINMGSERHWSTHLQVKILTKTDRNSISYS